MIQASKTELYRMRYELTDCAGFAIKPLLPNKPRGVPRVDDRCVLNGIFWVLRSGAPWRALPRSFGPYTTCYNRFVRWRRAGVWTKIMNALADRGYDADWIRALAAKKSAWASIPPRCNRSDPICFSPHLYRARNLVERFFNKIKHCRRVATRYDRLAANYLAFIKLASIRLWLRTYESTP